MESKILHKFFIVIPTRNRPDTVSHSIKTVLNQNYENYEIIVSDNSDDSRTEKLIKQIGNSKINYYRTPETLCMSKSWEFALSHVSEKGYVHILGDDNGIMPDCLSYVNNIFNHTSAEAIISNPIQYTWPSENNLPSINIPLMNKIFEYNSHKALKAAFNTTVGYDRLANINMGFISTDLINKVRTITGGPYFLSTQPDVISSLFNAFSSQSFIYSFKPFAINGGSVHSNGMAASKPSAISKFTDENRKSGVNFHPLFPECTSYYLNVFESFAVASDIFKENDRAYKINFKKLTKKIINNELIKSKRIWLIPYFKEFFKRINMEVDLSKYELLEYPDIVKNIPHEKISHGIYSSVKDYGFKNVFEAAIFSQKILENNESNKSIKGSLRYIYFSYLMGGKRINIL